MWLVKGRWRRSFGQSRASASLEMLLIGSQVLPVIFRTDLLMRSKQMMMTIPEFTTTLPSFQTLHLLQTDLSYIMRHILGGSTKSHRLWLSIYASKFLTPPVCLQLLWPPTFSKLQPMITFAIKPTQKTETRSEVVVGPSVSHCSTSVSWCRTTFSPSTNAA